MREKSVVLIVDDNPTNLSVLFNALRDSEFKVLAAQDGASAIQQAQHVKPDIILLDVMMPGLNGFETCKRIKDNPETRDIPVIFMTALSDINDKVNGFNVGAVDYVTKPLQHEEVVMRLSTHLRLRQMSELLRNKNAEMDMANRELKKNFDEVTRLQNIVKSYLSNRAWQSIETSGIQKTENGAVEAETLTVMMCDIEGFTPLLDRCEPGKLLHHLNLYMDILSNSIYAHGGEIDKFLGDGLLAFFRSPIDAVHAACDIQKQIKIFNKLQINGLEIPLPTRIGIATGKVLLAKIGTMVRKEYTLIGDRVNVAARLQSIAPVGGLAMDEVSFNAYGVIPGLLPDLIELKGKKKKEVVYQVSPESVLQLFHWVTEKKTA